jgi:hypothetical protein
VRSSPASCDYRSGGGKKKLDRDRRDCGRFSSGPGGPTPGAGDLFLPYVKTDPHPRRGSNFDPRRGSHPRRPASVRPARTPETSCPVPIQSRPSRSRPVPGKRTIEVGDEFVEIRSIKQRVPSQSRVPCALSSLQSGLESSPNPVPPVSRPINKECPDRTWPHRIPSRLFDLGHWTSDLGLRACPVPSAPTAVRGWVTDFVGHLL